MRIKQLLPLALLATGLGACFVPGGEPPTAYTTVAEVEPNTSAEPQVVATPVSPGSGLRLTGSAYGTNSSTGDFDTFQVTLSSPAASHQVTAECEGAGSYYIVLYSAADTLLDSGECGQGPFTATVSDSTIEVSVQNAAGTSADPTEYSVLVRST